LGLVGHLLAVVVASGFIGAVLVVLHLLSSALNRDGEEPERL